MKIKRVKSVFDLEVELDSSGWPSQSMTKWVDNIARKWGCPAPDDAFYSSYHLPTDTTREIVNSGFMAHFLKHSCGESNQMALCVRFTKTGKTVTIIEHPMGSCPFLDYGDSYE